jgi:hypothetical protein
MIEIYNRLKVWRSLGWDEVEVGRLCVVGLLVGKYEEDFLMGMMD